MKRRSKYSLLAAAVVAFLLLLVASLHTHPARRYALNRLKEYVRSSQSIDLTAAALRFNLLTLSVELDTLALRSASAADLPPFLTVDSVRARVSLLSLLQRKPVIEDARLDRVDIQVIADSRGRDNLPHRAPASAGQSGPVSTLDAPLPFLIAHLEIRRGSLLYIDNELGIRIGLPLWTLEVRGDTSAWGQFIRFHTEEPGRADLQDRSLPIGGLSLDAELRPGVLDLKHLGLEAMGSRVQAAGTLQNFDRPEIQLMATAGLNLRNLAEFAGLGRTVGGQMEVRASISGPLATVLVSSQLSGSALDFRDFRGIDLTAAATWDRGSERIRIESLDVRSPYGSVSGQAGLALRKEAGQSSAVARFRGLDLEAVSRDLRLPFRIASRASGNITAQWQEMEFEQAKGSADLRLSATRARPVQGVLPVTATLSAKATAGKIAINIDSCETLGARLRGSVSLTARRETGGEVRATTDSIGQVLGGLEAFLGLEPGSLAGTRLDGPLILDAELGGTLREPQVAARLDAPDTNIGEFRNVFLQANARYSPERIVIENADATWENQTLNAGGEIGLGGKSPELRLNAHVDRGSLGAIVNGLGMDLPIEGILNLDAAAGGSLSEVELSASLSLSGLRAYREELGTLALQANLLGRRLELTHLELAKPQPDGATGRLVATGSYDLDSKAYTLHTTATEIRFTNITLPGGAAVRGKLDLSADGTGSADNPSLNAKINLSDLEVGNLLIGAVDLTAGIEQQRAKLEARLPRFGLISDASVSIQSPYPARFELRAETDISKLGIEIAEDEILKGKVTATVRGSADLARWREGNASLVVPNLLMTVQGQDIRNQGPLEFGYENHRLDFRSASFVSGGSRISLNGSLPLEPEAAPGALNVNGSLDLSSLVSFLPGQPDLSADGILYANGTLRGNLKEIDPAVALKMMDGTFGHPDLRARLTNIALDVEYGKGAVAIHSLSAMFGPATIQAAGKVPLGSLPGQLRLATPAESGPARFSAEVKGLRVSDFREVPEPITGIIGFRLEGETPRVDDLGALRMKAAFSQLQLETGDYEIRQAAPVQLSLADGTVTIDEFLLTGPGTRLQARGTAGLTGDQVLDLHLGGNADIGIATLFVRGFKAQGDSRFELAVAGRLPEPEVSGFVETKQGEFALQDPPLAATDLNVRLQVGPRSVSIERFSGSLNGGDLSIAGTIGYGESGLEDVKADASVRNAFLDYPEGLRTQVSADLTLRSDGEFLIVGGEAHVLEGSYRRRLDIAGELMSYLRSDGSLQFAGEQDPLLSRLRFNVHVDTQGPLLVDNNLAKLTVNAGLRLTGTPYRPGLVGRVSLDQGGKLFFNERTYLVERGTISLVNQAKIEPDLDILATTQAGGYDISLNLTGIPDDFTANLSSDPPLSQPDVIAVLLTGRKLEELRGSGLNVAREQAESYLSGQLGGILSRGAQETLGLSMVRIDPSLISPEANPGARLTVGQDVTKSLGLIYSMNLVNASDQILSVRYDVTRRFQTEATRQSDNTYRFDFGHDLQFGGPPGAGRPAAAGTREHQIGTVEILGNTVFPHDRLLDTLGVKTGKKYDFFKLQKGVDRLRSYYRDRGYLECRTNVERKEKGRVVDLSVSVEAGPRVEIEYQGRAPSGNVRKQVGSAWEEGLFDVQRTQDAVQAIRNSLVQQGYLQAKVEPGVSTPSADEKRISFTIDAGVRFRDVVLDFEGASGIDASQLEAVLRDERLTTDLYVSPQNATTFLQRYYRQHGYLDARIHSPRYELNPGTGTGRVIIPVEEGPKFRVRRLELHGNKTLTDLQIYDALPLAPGDDYRPELLEAAAGRLEELYWAEGYNGVAVNYTLKRAPEAGDLDVDFQITENRQQVVEKIQIEGNRQTSNSLIRSQMALSPGDVLDYRKTNESRRRLYDTNAYTLVDIQPEPAGTIPSIPAGNQEPVALKVNVREVRPFELRYGGFYDTERGPGGIADFSNRNSLGSARLVGARLRYDSDVHELRGYFSQPFLRGFPVDTNVTGFFRREITKGQDTPDSGFITDRTGFTLQQEARFRQKFIFSYGYRFQRNHTYDIGPDPFFDITLKTAPLTATLTRDTRNDLLDASRGSFTSQAFEYAPSFLASDLRYVKYFGQYFHYLPLSRPTEVPWVGVKRNRLVLAGAIRVGLAGGLGGQDLIPSDKFFAGGGTTIRGFGQNEVGPRDFFGDPAGGNALFIINGELRFPLFGIFDGVGFLDIGNVYPSIRDFDPTDVRKSSGFGLRVRTPYFLIRADYGIKLDRRPGESPGRLFFSIGQAF